MNYRRLGNTDMLVSEIGFGAWAIGGETMVGKIPIGWGPADDRTSVQALRKALDVGINFFDTADFYGLGHSEEMIGTEFGNRRDIIIATKVGHKVGKDEVIELDYSKAHIRKACEDSLQRLKRDTIDLYQLHSARLHHLETGDCIESMQRLQQEGKIRYWGLSLNTFSPEPEATYMISNNHGHAFQLVFNIVNQTALPVMNEANKKGFGIIARMPLQFGLLTGKMNKDTTFNQNDHRNFRLTKEILDRSIEILENKIWNLCRKYNVSKTGLALSFILSFGEVSTAIPGIRTPQQATINTSGLVTLEDSDKNHLLQLFNTDWKDIVELMKQQG